MKYELRTDAPPVSLEAFAEQHGLKMIVRERNLDRWTREQNLPQFIARFEHVEIKDGSLLVSSCGDGATPDGAIADYARQIAGELLVIDAYQPGRREIRCPNAWL